MNEKLKKNTIDALEEVSIYLYYLMRATNEGGQYYCHYKEWKDAVDTAIAYIEDEH